MRSKAEGLAKQGAEWAKKNPKKVVAGVGGLALVGLLSALLLSPDRGVEVTTSELDQGDGSGGGSETVDPTQIPEMTATALATAVASGELGLGCFDFLGNTPDHYYEDGETTPYTTRPEIGQIVVCDNGEWDVTVVNPDGTVYHVRVRSPYQP